MLKPPLSQESIITKRRMGDTRRLQRDRAGTANAGIVFLPEPFSGRATFSLTPALSPRRGRTSCSVGLGPPFSDFSQRGAAPFPLLGERVRVRADPSINC